MNLRNLMWHVLSRVPGSTAKWERDIGLSPAHFTTTVRPVPSFTPTIGSSIATPGAGGSTSLKPSQSWEGVNEVRIYYHSTPLYHKRLDSLSRGPQ